MNKYLRQEIDEMNNTGLVDYQDKQKRELEKKQQELVDAEAGLTRP